MKPTTNTTKKTTDEKKSNLQKTTIKATTGTVDPKKKVNITENTKQGLGMKKEDTTSKLKTLNKDSSRTKIPQFAKKDDGKSQTSRVTKEQKEDKIEDKTTVKHTSSKSKLEEDISPNKSESNISLESSSAKRENSQRNIDISTTKESKEKEPEKIKNHSPPQIQTPVQSSNQSDLELMKKFAKEKQELGAQITDLTMKLEKEIKQHKETNKNYDQTIKDYELLSKNYDQSLNLQKETQSKYNELNSKFKELNKELAEMKKQLEEKNAKVEEAELDLEIAKEEYDGLKLEFEEYKVNSTNNQLLHLDENSAQAKIIDLENQINILTNALIKSDAEKLKEVTILKKENEKLQVKAKEAEELPERDEIIAILKETITNSEKTISDLKEQLEVFNSASSMIDDIIMEKNTLEEELSKEKAEKSQLKYEMETTDMLIEELESANKINEKMILDKDDEIINLKKLINTNKELIDKSEKAADDYVGVIQQLKKDIKTLKDEMSKTTNINVDEILNKNNNTASQLKTLSRQKILPAVSSIDCWMMELKSKVLYSLLPEGLIEREEGLLNYDKVLLLFSLRRKIGFLSINILENELLYEVQNVITATKEGDTNSHASYERLFNFLTSLVELLNSYFSALIKLEFVLLNSDLDCHKYKSIMKRNFWSNIQGSSQYVSNLINVIKEDTFGIDFSSQLEGFRTIVKYIIDDLNDLFSCEPSYKVAEFYSLTNTSICSTAQQYSKFIINNTVKDNDKQNLYLDELRVLINTYKKFTTKIESNLDYNNTLVIQNKKYFIKSSDEEEEEENKKERTALIYDIKALDLVFNSEQSNTQLLGQLNSLPEITSTEKLESSINILMQICQLSTSNLDKFEKSLIESETITSSNLNLNSNGMLSVIPLYSWKITCNDILEGLQNTSQIKGELQKYIESKLNLERQLIQTETNLQETIKAKKINDMKLAETTNQLGRIPIIEMEKEELQMKIDKCNITVDSLMSQFIQEQEKVKNLTVQIQNYSKTIKQELQPAKKMSIMENKRTHQRGGVAGNERSGLSSINNNSAMSRLQHHMSKERDTTNQGQINNPYGHATESAQLLHTVIQLQREKKLLKMKLLKDKLEEYQDENSYINKYINQIEELKPDYDMITEVEEDLNEINKDYTVSRKKLVTPKILDLSQPDYNYEKHVALEENNIKMMKVNYMNKVDNVLFTIFGTHSIDKTFKQVLDNTITKSLDFYEQKKVLIAKLKFNDEKLKHSITNENSELNKIEKNKVTIPVFVNEGIVKHLNKTFSY